MSSRWLAFDLEIAGQLPDGCQDWKEHRPLGITCAALAWLDYAGEIETQCFYGVDRYGDYMPRMSRGDCQRLAYNLKKATDHGSVILTHSGASFDLDILAEESGMFAECRDLALTHVDMCLHFFCLQGYPVGLNALAKGMGLPGKTEGMDGAQAPELWAKGEYDKVLEYVKQDVITTLEVALAVENAHYIRWIAKSGKSRAIPFKDGWLCVQDALVLPEPDVSWMTGREPWTRERFVGWMIPDNS